MSDDRRGPPLCWRVGRLCVHIERLGRIAADQELHPCAEVAGVREGVAKLTEARISKILNGQRGGENPNKKTRLKIAIAFGYKSVDAMYTEAADMRDIDSWGSTLEAMVSAVREVGAAGQPVA
jgi:hypothetical protein